MRNRIDRRLVDLQQAVLTKRTGHTTKFRERTRSDRSAYRGLRLDRRTWIYDVRPAPLESCLLGTNHEDDRQERTGGRTRGGPEPSPNGTEGYGARYYKALLYGGRRKEAVFIIMHEGARARRFIMKALSQNFPLR